MADREDFATAVGGLIKERLPVRNASTGQDVNTVREPVVLHVYSNALAASMPNLPAATLGDLVTQHPAGQAAFQTYYAYGSPAGRVYFRSVNNVITGTWSDWDMLGTLAGEKVPLVGDADTLTSAYRRQILDNAHRKVNFPDQSLGTLDTVAPAGKPAQWFQATGTTAPSVWWRGSDAAGALGKWAEIGGTASGEAAMQREARAGMARSRRGGTIGTGGVGTIALRFDDWADEMETVVMPVLRRLNLPASWGATVDYIEDPAKGSQTWATVTGWVRDGIDLVGHSWSHNSATGLAAISKETVESADYIETMVPEAKIDAWAMPGTSAGAETYSGFGNGDVLASYWDTPAGRLLMARYPALYGAVTGTESPLTGTMTVGQGHLTYETRTLAQAQDAIRGAQARGTGLVLMSHPAKLGTEGRMSIADFTTLMEWIAAERTAGRLHVVTCTGLAYADRSTDKRMNLLTNGSFADGFTGWIPGTWTLGEESGTTYARATDATSLAQDIPVEPHSAMRGSQVELVARVRPQAPTDARTLLPGRGVSRYHSVPANVWTEIHMPFTLLANLTTTESVQVAIQSRYGGVMDVTDVRVQAI